MCSMHHLVNAYLMSKKTPLTNTIDSQGKFYHKRGSFKPRATLWEKSNVEAFPEFVGFIANFYSHDFLYRLKDYRDFLAMVVSSFWD